MALVVEHTPETEITRFRVEAANLVLWWFAHKTQIVKRRDGRIAVSWSGHGGQSFSRVWQTRRQDFYPVWSHKWAHGGTACTALSQLVRWVQDKPVLPLGTWRHWCGPRVALGRENGPKIVTLLQERGYPEHVDCVLCHVPIVGGLDWWSLNGVSGPCCHHTEGCRQKPNG
jgi:hypothetical protein